MSNRAIKFRAWDESHKTYVPNAWLREETQFITNEVLELPNPAKWVYEQFTGLLDKNGREIYEGDILEYIVPDYCSAAGQKTYGIVESGPWSFKIKPIDYQALMQCIDDRMVYSGICPTESVVIGNIHENPELLKS